MLIAAALVAGLSLLDIAGWLFSISALVQLGEGYPVFFLNSALGLLGGAIALWGYARSRTTWLTTAAAGLTFLIGAATLIEYLWQISFGIDTLFVGRSPLMALPGLAGGRMPAISAFNLALAGMGLLALGRRRWRPGSLVAAGTIGTILAAVSTTVIVSYLGGMLPVLRSGGLIGLSVHSAVAYTALGIGMMLVSWRRDASAAVLPVWIPYGGAIAVIVATLILWRALSAADRVQYHDRLDMLAGVASRTINARVTGAVDQSRRRSEWVAGRITSRPVTPAEWNATGERLLTDSPGVLALLWLDSTGARIAGIRAVRSLAATTIQAEGVVAAALRSWPDRRQSRATLIQALSDDAGEAVFSLAVPICGVARCTGFTVVLFEPRDYFGPSLADMFPGYRIGVGLDGLGIYTSALSGETPDSGWLVRRSSAAGGRAWTAELWPTSRTASFYLSDLPFVVLALGIGVGILLGLTLRLLRVAGSTAREDERARVARAMDTAADGLWEHNHKSGRTMRSPAVWRRLGYEIAGNEVATTEWETLIHPEDREAYRARVQEAAASISDAVEIEYRVEARNGEWHWIVDRGRVVERDDRGKPVMTLGLTADVTDRKRSDQALVASEQRFRTMFDRGFQLEHLLDVNCNLIESNRTSLDLAGVEVEAVRGRAIWSTPWWEGNPARVERLQTACREALLGKTVRYKEQLGGGNGRLLAVDFSLTPIIDKEGRVIQLLAECRDITERQRMEDALRELDTLSTMGRLAARVAHEINNPLAGIQNSFLLVKNAIPETHPYYSYVGAIEREIARMAAVTRRLYETYRSEGDTREEASVPVVVSDAVKMLEQISRAAAVRIDVDTGGSPATLPVPSSLLRVAVYNLLENAVEASPRGGLVQVKAWSDDNAFWLSVRDQGPGVPEDIRERIFEPFMTTKGDKTGSMGLGLMLARRAVQALGGRIDLRHPPGGGAEFLIEFSLR